MRVVSVRWGLSTLLVMVDIALLSSEKSAPVTILLTPSGGASNHTPFTLEQANEGVGVSGEGTLESAFNVTGGPFERILASEIGEKMYVLHNKTYALRENAGRKYHSCQNFHFQIEAAYIYEVWIQISNRSCVSNPRSIIRGLVTSEKGIRTAITTTCLRRFRQHDRHHDAGSLNSNNSEPVPDDADEKEEDEEDAEASDSSMVPSASTVICPISRHPDEIWIDAAGTPGTQFNMIILATDSAVKLEQKREFSITGFGRDPDSDDHSSFTKILTFYLRRHQTQVALKIFSDDDDFIPAEFTLLKECHDGTAGSKKETRKIRGQKYASRLRMTARRAGTLILSSATHPTISEGKWHLGITLLDPKIVMQRFSDSNYSTTKNFSLPSRRRNVLLTKTFSILISDESDAFQIWPMIAWGCVSALGLLAPVLYYKLLAQVQIKFGVKLGKAWVSVILNWLLRGHKTYSYITALFGVTLAVGAFQMVQENWYRMLVVGNRDLCFYNEKCYITNLVYDYPFNLISSNMCYVLHGMIVGLSLSIREAYCFSEGHALYYDYSLGYALSWALVFEGVFSSIYHICPSRLIFQFDTNFMYLIGALTIACVFHGNSITQQTLLLLQRYSHLTEDVKEALNLLATQKCLHHTKIYLFFAAPILTFNYLGSIKDVSGFGPLLQVVFGLLVICWALLILVWSGCKLDIFPDCVGLWKPKILAVEINEYGVLYKDAELSEVYEPRKSKFSYVVAVLYLFYTFALLYLLLAQLLMNKGDIAQLFLLICVGTGFVAMVCGEYRECLAYSKLKLIRLSSVVAYYLLIFALWVCAAFCFKAKAVTHKSKKPYESREANRDCIIFGFYDYHDLWHLLSSFALLLTSYRVILLSHPCKMCQFSYIRSMMTGSRDIEIKVDVIAPTPRPSPSPLKRSDTLEDIPESDEMEEVGEGDGGGEEGGGVKNEKNSSSKAPQSKRDKMNDDEGRDDDDYVDHSVVVKSTTMLATTTTTVAAKKTTAVENGDMSLMKGQPSQLKSPSAFVVASGGGEKNLLSLPAFDEDLVRPERRVRTNASYLASAEDISELETGYSLSDEALHFKHGDDGDGRKDHVGHITLGIHGDEEAVTSSVPSTLQVPGSCPLMPGGKRLRRRNKERITSPPQERCGSLNPGCHGHSPGWQGRSPGWQGRSPGCLGHSPGCQGGCVSDAAPPFACKVARFYVLRP